MLESERALAMRIADTLGDIQVRALQAGGEELLQRVEGALGPALRLLNRLYVSALPMTPAVRREIDASIERARALLPKGEVNA